MGMKTGGLSIDRNALNSGLAHLDTIRGTTTWGANYVFHSGGLQNDVRIISEEFSNLSTSGSFATDAEVATSVGLLSGYISSGTMTITGNATDAEVASAISTVSGYLVASGTTYNQPTMNEPVMAGPIATNLTIVTAAAPSTSGTVGLGTAAAPFDTFTIASTDTGVPMSLVVYANGLVSGIAV